MISNIFHRLLTNIRPISNYQQHFLRLLSTTEPMSTENISNNRETGTVKRFSKEKGYGFISKNSDGTDCFVHFKNINTTGFKTLEQGQEVEFTIVQGEKGLEARDVNVTNMGTGRMPFGGGSPNNNSTSSRFGFGGGGGGGGSGRNQSSAFDFGGNTSSKFYSRNDEGTSPNSMTENSFSSRRTQFDNDQTREIGSVKRWTNDRGFGFIRRTNGGPDLFCHVRSLKGGIQSLDEGQTVEYRIQRTDKGEEARDVTVFNEEGGSMTDSNERQTGTVRRWIPEKNYGFIRRDTGGSDVFVHIQDLSDGTMSLEEGQIVEFNIKINEKGEMAENVIIRNEP